MTLHVTPLHPGRYIKDQVFPPGLSVKAAAELLGVGRPALSNLLNGNAALSPEMALRIEKAFGASQKDLLQIQADYDQHRARNRDQNVAVRAYVPSFLKITARDIEQCANGNLEARSRLPVLLRKLVHSTGQELSHVDFPGYDNAEKRGWDGRVDAGAAIAAGSPQAKGRIERLWETLQDRLPAELRVHHITTVADVQAFLPHLRADYNRRFTHASADRRSAWRRPPPDFPAFLSCRYLRTVAGDNTVRLGDRWVQIPPGPAHRSYARCRVEVRECLDGRLLVRYQERRLAVGPAPAGEYTLIPRKAPRPHRLRASQSAREEGGPSLPTPRHRTSMAQPAALATDLRRRPAHTHPWRRAFSHRRREPAKT